MSRLGGAQAAMRSGDTPLPRSTRRAVSYTRPRTVPAALLPPSKPPVQPVFLVEYLAHMPEAVWSAHLHSRRRLGVEITLADAGAPAAGLDKAHAFTGKLARRALASPRSEEHTS